MKANYLLTLIFSFFLFAASAQYCNPSVTSTGVYISSVQFGLGAPFTAGITSGVSNFSGSQGYTNNSGTSSGTINRNCALTVPINLQNSTASNQNINIRVFIDWNNDNDFDDAGETVWDYDYPVLVAGNFLGASFTIYNVAYAPSTVRMRIAMRQGGSKATACGGYTGEIEDYKLNFNTNISPAVSGAVPYIDGIKESQVNNEGATLSQLLTSPIPATTVTTDADPCIVPGIAITGVTAANGGWQYKIASGTWTSFGAVAVTNALQLSGRINDSVRVRFVPTGPGTSNFTFKAWDLSTGVNGTYSNATTSGGSTSFSTSTSSLSLVTYSTSATAGDVNAYLATTSNIPGQFNVQSSSLDKASGSLKLPVDLTTDGVNGTGNDIDIDVTNNKLVWAGGADGTQLLRSNLDGSNVEILGTGLFGYPTGIAAGGGKIFVADYDALYSFNSNGTGMTLINSTVGFTTDIEFANNKIYYVTQPGYTGNLKIMQANVDGSNAIQLYSTGSLINGLFVTDGSLYWTEVDGANNASVKIRLLAGGAITTLVTEANQYFVDLQADESHALIYFLSANMPSYDHFRVKRIPLTGGASTRVLDFEYAVNSIVFQKSTTLLPVRFISINAARQGSTINIAWKVGQEENLEQYTIERSSDGNHFTPVGHVDPRNQAQYTWADQYPLPQINYYRIQAINTNGSGQYSNIVAVNPDNSRSGITVYPTLVTGKTINVKLSNVPSENYHLQMVNSGGQLIYQGTITSSGGTSVETVNLPQAATKGIYRLTVRGATYSSGTTIVLQ